MQIASKPFNMVNNPAKLGPNVSGQPMTHSNVTPSVNTPQAFGVGKTIFAILAFVAALTLDNPLFAQQAETERSQKVVTVGDTVKLNLSYAVGPFSTPEQRNRTANKYQSIWSINGGDSTDIRVNTLQGIEEKMKAGKSFFSTVGAYKEFALQEGVPQSDLNLIQGNTVYLSPGTYNDGAPSLTGTVGLRVERVDGQLQLKTFPPMGAAGYWRLFNNQLFVVPYEMEPFQLPLSTFGF